MSNHDFYLTFNYTNTLEDIYCIPSQNILHIHGSLKKLNENFVDSENENVTNSEIRNEIQFGSVENYPLLFQDDLVNEYEGHEFWETDIRFIIDEVIDFCAGSYKNIDRNFPKLDKFLSNAGISEIVVMGLSFGDSDIPYMEKINMKYSNSSWLFYYHEKDDKLKYEGFIKENNLKKFEFILW